jgi:hypothetical protein
LRKKRDTNDETNKNNSNGLNQQALEDAFIENIHVNLGGKKEIILNENDLKIIRQSINLIDGNGTAFYPSGSTRQNQVPVRRSSVYATAFNI